MNKLLILCIFFSTFVGAMESSKIQYKNMTEKAPFSLLYLIEAYDGAKKIGFMSYNPINEYNERNEWKIQQFRVASNYHKQKIGSALMAQCIESIKQFGGKKVYWNVVPAPIKEDSCEIAPNKKPPFTTNQLVIIYKKIMAKIGYTNLEIKEFSYHDNENVNIYVDL